MKKDKDYPQLELVENKTVNQAQRMEELTKILVLEMEEMEKKINQLIVENKRKKC